MIPWLRPISFICHCPGATQCPRCSGSGPALADVAINNTVVPTKSSFFTSVSLEIHPTSVEWDTAFHDHAHVGVRSHAGATSNQSPCFCKGMSGVPLTSDITGYPLGAVRTFSPSAGTLTTPVEQRGGSPHIVDAAVVPGVRGQRRAAPTSCARLQPRQFPAHAGDARADQGLVTDKLEGEADQDRREGGEPRPLCRLPNGRGRHPTANVPRDFAAHRGTATAATTSASVDVRWSCVQGQQTASLCQEKSPDETL